MIKAIYHPIRRAFTENPAKAKFVSFAVIAFAYKRYTDWMDVSPIWEWLDKTIAKSYGPDWLEKLLSSPVVASGFIVALLFILWRTGNNASRRERDRENVRVAERRKVQELPANLMSIFWKREMLRLSEGHKLSCKKAIDDCTVSLGHFRDKLPCYEKPYIFTDVVREAENRALYECNQFKALIAADAIFENVSVPDIRYVPIPEGEPKAHPNFMKFDAEHNQHYISAHEHYIRSLNIYYSHLDRCWQLYRDDVDRASDELKRRIGMNDLGQL
jgi:hypothetical protein